MCYSFSSCPSLPCISLLLLEITRESRRGWVCVRMRGITPTRPQFETQPILLDVIEVLRPLNKAGLYSREASIRGNTVFEPVISPTKFAAENFLSHVPIERESFLVNIANWIYIV